MAKLTAKRRNSLPSSDFAVPSERKFPDQDRSHAANAKARASGTKYQAQVDRAVARKYPGMGKTPDHHMQRALKKRSGR